MTTSDVPDVTVEVAFANNPGDSSLTWTNVTDYVETISTRRGRNSELDQFQAGTATLLLQNDDRRFDPTYTTGPYYGQLLPMKRIRITASWDAGSGAVVYPIFAGFVEGWPQTYSDGGFLNYVPLRCTDLFKALQLSNLTTTYPSQYTGARVAAVLNDLGWPAGERSIATGQSLLQASTLTNTPGMEHLIDVNGSENGLLFVARDGKATFIDRDTLILAAQDATLVWGDDGTEYPYTGITLDPQDANLYNDITVTAPGLADQNAQSAASITQFFHRSKSRATLLADTGQMNDLANFLLIRLATPQDRIVAMTMDGLPTTTFAPLLGREIGDKIRVHRRPTGGGSIIEQDSIIEAIGVDIAARSWQFSFDLSPSDPVSNYWVMGDAAQSLVGSTTRFAY